MSFKRRIMKEVQKMELAKVDGLTFISTEDISHWYIDVAVKDNPLYPSTDLYTLEVKAGETYPIDPPIVKFVQGRVPIHPHIYSNGHICLDILGGGWTPVQTIESIAISIQSMLASNTKAERPPDNDSYVQHAPSNPQLTRFAYHDDTI